MVSRWAATEAVTSRTFPTMVETACGSTATRARDRLSRPGSTVARSSGTRAEARRTFSTVSCAPPMMAAISSRRSATVPVTATRLSAI